MSRSYKKTPWCGDHKGKIKKRIANQTVRQMLKNYDLIVQKGAYKKLYCSYDICDYGWICSWEDYWEGEWNTHIWISHMRPDKEHKEPDKKECYRKWLKYYRNK